MEKEIIVAIIPSVGAIIVTLLSVFLADIFKRLDFKSSNETIKYKEQYEKVFSPIHNILFFNRQKNNVKTYIKIKKILIDNYNIVPQGIIDSFNEINKFENNTSNFENNINYCFHYLGNKLGCSKQELDKSKKKIAKEILNCKSEELLVSIQIRKILIITLAIVLSIYYLLYFTTKNTTIAFLAAIIIPVPTAIIILLKNKII